MTAQITKTAGAKLKTLNGSNLKPVPTGVSWVLKMLFRRVFGLRLSLVVLDGRWMISCGLLSSYSESPRENKRGKDRVVSFYSN